MPFVCNFLAAVKNKASHLGVAGVIKSINPITTVAAASMNYRVLGKISYHSAILLACVTLSCSPRQAVILSPGDTDLVVLNGCVISACNYRSEEHTSELQSQSNLVCRLLLEKKKNIYYEGEYSQHNILAIVRLAQIR